eukprot:14517195-Alexandrium_andersonii.AAC.1
MLRSVQSGTSERISERPKVRRIEYLHITSPTITVRMRTSNAQRTLDARLWSKVAPDEAGHVCNQLLRPLRAVWSSSE